LKSFQNLYSGSGCPASSKAAAKFSAQPIRTESM